MTPPALSLSHVTLQHPGSTLAAPVVHDLSLEVQPGDIACLLGPSGCGKTTVLRAIAGFHPVHRGHITLHGQTVSSPEHHVPPEARRIGMVFQDFALFPHLSVHDNVGFGLHRHSRPARQQRIIEMLELVGMVEHAQRYPHELSGGQQQRVALARALAPAPQLLLLDEPFSSLDVHLREHLAHEVRRVLKATGTTAVMVTHDQHEAFAIADRIGVLHQACLQQWDTALGLYHEPANRFVAGFIGEATFLPGQVDAERVVHTELGAFDLDDSQPSSDAVELMVRPDDIVHDDASPLQARVVAKAFRGSQFFYTLALPSGQLLYTLAPSHHDHAIGEFIGIRIELDHVICF